MSHRTVEQHSLQSLSARLGVSRATALGAIVQRKLGKVETEKVGERKIYRLSPEAISDYKNSIRTKLEERINRITPDPIRRQEMAGSALAALRDDAAAEQQLWDAPRLAEKLGITLEGASYLLGKYAERVENGFRVSPAAMAKIIAHREQTRGGGIIQSKGGVYVA